MWEPNKQRIDHFAFWDSQFAIRECRMDAMVLKPQDVYVALKIVASPAGRAPYSQLAADLVMSPSEVHASVRRGEGSHLLHGPQRKNRPNFSALLLVIVTAHRNDSPLDDLLPNPPARYNPSITLRPAPAGATCRERGESQ